MIQTFSTFIHCLTFVLQTVQSANQSVVRSHDFGYGCHSVWLWTWFLHNVSFNADCWKMSLQLFFREMPDSYVSVICMSSVLPFFPLWHKETKTPWRRFKNNHDPLSCFQISESFIWGLLGQCHRYFIVQTIKFFWPIQLNLIWSGCAGQK